MRAYRLTSYDPDGFAVADVPEPETGPGQIKVRIEQIGVNPLEWKIRNGHVPQMVTLPMVIGTDVAGTVLEVGPGVDDVAVGDRVAGFADTGAYATVAVTRRERVTRVPDAGPRHRGRARHRGRDLAPRPRPAGPRARVDRRGQRRGRVGGQRRRAAARA